MTAQRLRDAAQKIRDTAQAATPGTWTTEDSRNETDDSPQVWQVQRNGLGGYGIATCRYRGEANRCDAEHIALWSPPVALAVADWLAVTAYDVDSGVETPESAAALAVVELILGNQP